MKEDIKTWARYNCKCGEELFSDIHYKVLHCQNCGEEIPKQKGKLYTSKEMKEIIKSK